MEVNGENNSFITLKGHKKDFNNNPTIRPIIPEKMGLKQRRNKDTVIDWLKDIRNKHLCKFVVLGIKEFYPSITENLL